MKKNSPVIDRLKFLNLLSSGVIVKDDDLIATFQISKRTLQRWVNDLKTVGYEIKRVADGYILIHHDILKNTNFSDEESGYVVRTLRNVLNMNQNISTDAHRDALLKMIHAIHLKHITIKQIETVETRRPIIDNYYVYSSNYKTLEGAIDAREFVRINYNTAQGENKIYRIQAYELFMVNQIWYLGGLNEYGEIRYFKGTRIYSVDRTKDKYFYDEKVADQIKIDNYGFEIDVEAVVVRVRDNNFFKEFEWGSDQVIIDYPDGSYDMKVKFKNRLGAKNFILTGGHHFEVLEPKHLVQWIQKEADKIKSNYA